MMLGSELGDTPNVDHPEPTVGRELKVFVPVPDRVRLICALTLKARPTNETTKNRRMCIKVAMQLLNRNLIPGSTH
jgi:hypothetical protein